MSHRDPIDALHAALLQLDGGISAAAKAIGRSPGTLHNKFSDSMPHYEVTAREAIALADHAKTTVYVEEMCQHFGGVFLGLPASSGSDDDLLGSYMLIIQQMGELSKEFTEARADGVIELSEYNAIELRGHRTIAAISRHLSDLKSMVRELPPRGGAPLSLIGSAAK